MNLFIQDTETQLCDKIPYHPYALWDCEWSDSMRMKTCRKSCLGIFKLSSGSTQLKCHFKNGWQDKEMAKCEIKKSRSCENAELSTQIEKLPLEFITCSKYKFSYYSLLSS